MENNLYVSPSPHIHGGDSISKNMYGVLIALIPAFLVSLYFIRNRWIKYSNIIQARTDTTVTINAPRPKK